MSDPSASMTKYRFTCPHCQKVLKIRTDWGGKQGVCPNCKNTVKFPVFKAPDANSATTQQLLKLIAGEDNPKLSEAESERLALLLSQATCRDYAMAHKDLGERLLSPRQWRRVLNAADLREGMRLRIDARLAGGTVEDPAEEPAAVLAAMDAAGTGTANAWKILSRFLYFQRHGACEGCAANPTGLMCMYLNFDTFCAARQIPEGRAEGWRTLMHHHLGL